MPFNLHALAHDSEFSLIVPVQNRAYSMPFSGFWEILKGESLEEWDARQKLWHHHDPTSHWIYITEDKTGKVAGAMQWNIHDTNPYGDGAPKLSADWWPEGEMREFSNQVLAQFFEARPSLMSKPHFLVSYCFVDPSFRHQGAGSLMMEWGLRQADARGMESFVESSEDGEKFYAAHGFQTLRDFTLDAVLPHPTEKFNELRSKLTPIHGYMMWRPAGSKKA